jgi:hypothetical protein
MKFSKTGGGHGKMPALVQGIIDEVKVYDAAPAEGNTARQARPEQP